MKKIFSYAMLSMAFGLAVVSCDTDLESNPTLVAPVGGVFTVNTHTYGNAQIDLATSKGIELSWSQPQFTVPNAPVVVNYEIQLSNKGTFYKAFDASLDDNSGADYIALDETYTDCRVVVPASEIDKALEQLNGWSDPSELVFLHGGEFYMQVRAFVQNASFEVLSECNSNSLAFNFLPYYIELKAADPDMWYLIGGDIADGKWGSDVAVSVLPLQPVDGFEYDAKTGAGEVTWTGYLAGNGFKLKHTTDSWDEQWGQGDAFGSFVKNDGGSGNISVPAPGIYTVTLNTASDKLTVVEAAAAPVFSGMCISGDFNEWGDTEMSPVHTYEGAECHDWYATVTLDGSQGIKFKEPGSWDYNTGGPVNELSDGIYGYGSNNGDNIFPAAGTYLVIYNDITRYYRFIAK